MSRSRKASRAVPRNTGSRRTCLGVWINCISPIPLLYTGPHICRSLKALERYELLTSACNRQLTCHSSGASPCALYLRCQPLSAQPRLRSRQLQWISCGSGIFNSLLFHLFGYCTIFSVLGLMVMSFFRPTRPVLLCVSVSFHPSSSPLFSLSP